MKNKIQFKNVLICSIVITLLFNMIFGIFQFYQYKIYRENFNAKISTIITKVKEEYPNINKNELIEILNNTKADADIFKDYGIDLSDDALVLENDKNFRKNLCINIIIFSIAMLLMLAMFLIYYKSKNKTLNEIIKYIEEINNKNYKLDIDDNREDELSILKNEIYKTTITLKEIAENSREDKIKLKDSLSDISHQLKTPLTAITILIDNIIENTDMDKSTRIEFEKDIKREITNISFLVQSLLKLSKFDADSVKFMNEYISVSKIISNSVKNISVLCELKNIDIEVTGNENAKIYCDLKWQVEAITNILKNCVEHSNENSKIQVIYEENQVYSKIEIRDYGVGIDKEDLPHIFERFYKGKNSSNESIGIGLALSKTIIESNNGYVGVESEIGKGTRFTIKYFK